MGDAGRAIPTKERSSAYQNFSFDNKVKAKGYRSSLSVNKLRNNDNIQFSLLDDSQ